MIRRAAALVFVLSGSQAAIADPPGEAMEREHTRHTHARGDKHPAAPDASRFLTDRDSPVVLPLPGEEDAFFFVVYGDRTGGPDEGVSVLKDAVRDTNLLEPDLVMTVGDLIQGYNQTEPWRDQMREFRAIMDELVCPWFPVAGNHDIYWRGEGRPDGEHESNYEMHFGPLWYAFEHKNSWFIVLYTDEGNPETDERTFNKPASQTMSPRQFEWLKGTLGKAAGADHVFLFVHHPRWRAGNYGNDWDRVHELLVGAGNVSAVFGGHIHRMKYREVDGIEYFALATVGGHQGGQVPEAGQLHHYNIVTVRKGQIATSSIPVGASTDPRALTEELTNAAVALSQTSPGFDGELEIGSDGSAGGVVQVRVPNPTEFAIEMTLTPAPGDPRWSVNPDHVHWTIEPGKDATFRFQLDRLGGPVDEGYADLGLDIDIDLLTPSARFSIPTVRSEFPADLRLHRPQRPDTEHVLALGGGGYVAVPDNAFTLPDGPMTVETWMRADRFGRRVGLVCKTESSDYGLFANGGVPSFTVHLGGSYRNITASDTTLPTERWVHVAGVFDGSETRLYVDGRLVSSAPASGARATNGLPLIIGGDVDWSGRGASLFEGQIDGVRVSAGAVYSGDRFEPARRPTGRDDTVLLLNMDGSLAGRVFEESTGRTARLSGGASVIEAP